MPAGRTYSDVPKGDTTQPFAAYTCYQVLAQSYQITAQYKEARAEAADVLRINPKFSLDLYVKRFVLTCQSENDKFINGLRKAGLK